jgi:formyl-CoA transferase
MGYPGLAGEAPLVSPPAMLSRTPPTIDKRSPTVGEHTDEILLEAGYEQAQIDLFREAGVV